MIATFDLRRTRDKDLRRSLELLDNQSKTQFGESTRILRWIDKHTMVVEYQPVSTIQSKDQVSPMTITGATVLGDQFRAQLAAVKDKINKASLDMSQAISELSNTADAANDAVKQVKNETADLKAALGLNTNGGPSDG